VIKFLIILAIFALSTVVSIPQSIAQESSNSTIQYALQLKQLKVEGIGKVQPVTYGIFYVSDKDQCDDYDKQRLTFYEVMTDEYLALYELAHTQQYAACISAKDYDKYFSEISPTVIPIVIMDKVTGQKLLVQLGNIGLYTISGIGSESILVCACDNDVESWTGAWVLSHELSHLALYRYGAPESVYFTWVHYNEAMSQVCKILDQSNFCPEYSTVLTAPSGNSIPVMEIFGQGATAYNMPASPPQVDTPIFQQPSLENGLGKAVQAHVLPITPQADAIAAVEIIGLKPLVIDGKIYPVTYHMTGGIVQDLHADAFTKKLTIEVIGGGNGGHLQLHLSRKIMDSMQENNDTKFIVNNELANGTITQLDYVESHADTQIRTLEINFPQDRSVIAITGSVMVPEFPLPATTLVISLVTLIVFYRVKLQK
jgi:hypothetical protein